MNTNSLFTIASAAKQCGDYELANQIFAVLAYESICQQSEIYIGYEQEGDDIIENLFDQDNAGYLDLPFLFDSSGNYLCIPLPLVSRWFCNHVVWRCVAWSDRDESSHDRNPWRLSHCEYKKLAASRDLWRRFREEVPQEDIDLAVRTILRQEEEVPEQENAT